jgi:hypothetical protein
MYYKVVERVLVSAWLESVEGLSMDCLIIGEVLKSAAEFITPVSKLVEALKSSKDQSFQQAYNKMRNEAIVTARGFEHNLDNILQTASELGIDINKSTLRDADNQTSDWPLVRRMMLRRVSSRLSRLAAGIKDFYADMESIFVCAHEQEVLREARERGYQVRDKITDAFLREATIHTIVDTMRQPVREALEILSAPLSRSL